MMRCAIRAGRIPTRCNSSRTGCHLSHLAENIYKTHCCIQILTIPAAYFIGRTATSGSTGPGVPHDVNVYPQLSDGHLQCTDTGNCNRLKPAYQISRKSSLADFRKSSVRHIFLCNNSLPNCRNENDISQ